MFRLVIKKLYEKPFLPLAVVIAYAAGRDAVTITFLALAWVVSEVWDWVGTSILYQFGDTYIVKKQGEFLPKSFKDVNEAKKYLGG